MELAYSKMISLIDSFAERELALPTDVLMGRSGEAVADAVRSLVKKGDRVIVLAGCGNNGGDGYAAGTFLLEDYDVEIFNVLSKEPKSDAARSWKNKYASLGGVTVGGLPSEGDLEGADCVVDAIFGTGYTGDVTTEFLKICRTVEAINTTDGLKVVAVDIPFGVNADYGNIGTLALKADITVALSIPKIGLFSYPAKEYVGRVEISDLGIDRRAILNNFEFHDYYLDAPLAASMLRARPDNSNKGSFGRATLVVGSAKYPGAAMLALEAALRGGAGYVSFVGADELCRETLLRFPEAIYSRLDYRNEREREQIVSLISKSSSVLVGSGCGVSKELYLFVSDILSTEGCPAVLDADALNSISEYGSARLIKEAKRTVIITPHPLEFARIAKNEVDFVQSNRYMTAKSFAKENNCIVVLKGAATVISDGVTTYINGSGSSALAKAGSGDVLAGLLVSMLAYSDDALGAAALAAFVHGRAGDLAAAELSSYGVTPSDLPKTAAKIIAEIEAMKKNGI